MSYVRHPIGSSKYVLTVCGKKNHSALFCCRNICRLCKYHKVSGPLYRQFLLKWDSVIAFACTFGYRKLYSEHYLIILATSMIGKIYIFTFHAIIFCFQESLLQTKGLFVLLSDTKL